MKPETEKRKALEEDAAHWLASLDAGTATPESFEVWRSADPARAAAFLRAASVWTTLDQAKLHTSPDDWTADAVPQSEAPARQYDRRKMLRAGAVGGVALLAGTAFLATRQSMKSASTEIGERRIVRLEDGGSIELNTQSAVSWRIDDERRRIRLEHGEVALSVPPARSGNCRLDAGGCIADLSPGQYGARVSEDGLRLFVVDGAALVWVADAANQARPVRLAPTETAIFNASDIRRGRLSTEDMASLSAWRRGEIILQGQTLTEAVADYNRYLTKKIVLADPQLADLRLGGRFLTSEPDAFLRALTTQFGARVRSNDRSIVVTL